MYYFFFINSSVDGLFDCFYVLAIVNSAAMSTGVCVSFHVSFLWDIYVQQSKRNVSDRRLL